MSAPALKGLSVRQPWAWAIATGLKPVENRTWRTHYRGPIVLHASQRYDREGEVWMRQVMGLDVPADLPRGGIVGWARLYDCVEAYASPWFFGPYGFVFTEPQGLAFTPLRGRLGLFDVSAARLGVRPSEVL